MTYSYSLPDTTEQPEASSEPRSERAEVIRRGTEMQRLILRRIAARDRAAARDPLAMKLPTATDEELAIVRAGQEASMAGMQEAFTQIGTALQGWINDVVPAFQNVSRSIFRMLYPDAARRHMLREARARARQSTQRRRRRRARR